MKAITIFMKALIALSVLAAVLPPCAFAAIRGPGKYNGVVIFDRWDGCHLFGGVYDMEVSQKVKELLRPYNGQAILVDAKEVSQPMNPGDGLITKLEVLGPAEEPSTKTGGNAPPLLDGLVLTAAPNFPEGGHGEFVITLRNTGQASREVDMDALGPTLFAKKSVDDCMVFMGSPSDGPSYAAATRRSIPSLYTGGASSCGSGDKQISIRLFLEPGLVLPEHRSLAAGETVEVPIQFELTPGEYEFVAGYGGAVHAARLLATNLLDFDVDTAGRAHLVGDAVKANLNRRPAPIGPVCGKVELTGAEVGASAKVYLWPYPLEKRQPRAVNSTTADADGSFIFDGVRDGKYVLTATLNRPPVILAGTLGAPHAADAPALSLPIASGQCSLQIRLAPQPVYSVVGHTEPNPSTAPVRKVQVRMITGDAYPFEADTIVQPDGRYEFHNLPEGDYQFFAGSTGSGFKLNGAIEDLDVPIRWPDQNASAKIGSGPQGMPPSFNQTMAYLALTQVHQAENTYAERYGKGFSANLAQLGQPPSWSGPTSDRAGLFDPEYDLRGLDDGAMTYSSQGYRVTYVPSGRDQSRKVTSYQITARPTEYGKTGTQSFWMDETGAIHQTEADRSATRDDPKAQLQ
jgi:hypothetical protein